MASKVKSTLYSAAGVYSNQILSFVTAAILGRLLDPKDFGLVALLILVNGFLALFASAGVSSVIIQFRDLGQKELRALIGLCWAIGLVLTGLAIAAAQPLSSFFSAPALIQIVPIGSVALLLTPVSQIVDGVLVREGRFGLRSMVGVSSALAGSAAGVSLALLGYGYWALVVQMIVRPLAALVVGFSSIRMLPLPGWDLGLYRRVGKYAANLVGFRFLNYWTQNIDNLLIGRQLSVADLGYYSRAYALFNLSVNMIQAVIGPILHTSFAKVRDEPEKLKKEVSTVLSIVASLSMPLMGVASIYSAEIIRVAWGPNWDSAVVPFSLLAVAGIFRPVQAVAGEAMKTLGRTGELLGWGAFRFALYLVGVLLGLQVGITGVALGVTMAAIINWLVFSNIVLVKHLRFSPHQLFICYRPGLKLFIGMILIAYTMKYFLPQDLNYLIRLSASLPVFAASYFLLAKMFGDRVYGIVQSLISQRPKAL